MYGPCKVTFLVAILSACLLVQSASGLARCMETLKDSPCEVSGALPARLQCRVGKWFSIKHIWHQSPLGEWLNADLAAVETAKKQCKASRARNSRSGYYDCTITSLGLKHVQRVIVQYMCWELDPEVLEGFGPIGGFNFR